MISAAHLTRPLRIIAGARSLTRQTPWHLQYFNLVKTVHTGAGGSKARPAIVKSKTIRDVLSPTPSHLLTLLLSDMLRGHDDNEQSNPSSSAGDASQDAHDSSPPLALFNAPRALPPGHSLVYFPLQTPASRLAPDGADADHVPDAQFGRRLWAGGELTFRRRGELGLGLGLQKEGGAEGLAPRKDGREGDVLMDCSPWTCREDVRGVRRYAGAGGERYVVRLERFYARGAGSDQGARTGWDIREARTLVFKRGDGDMVAPCLTQTPHAGSYAANFTATPAQLFHFSALTYNAHGIHIDPLAARHDGHPALLVHGPLTLALMLRVLGDYLSSLGRIRTGPGDGEGSGARIVNFAYRNYAPLYAAQRASVKVRHIQGPEDPAQRDELYEVWIENGEGGVVASGTATVEPQER